ncbi:MAG TPA: hypothetical protein VKY73_09130 [Polyangiaceae bacterium]|nr:hypothetical protein [Polyangiaceae bacterium]
MRARAPGKVVVSGAYAVLEGAPALVAAVDRHAVADTERAPAFVTPEVRAALGEAPAPFVDASALRSGERKLGLGSSAAILVASLGARAWKEEPEAPLDVVRSRVFPRALAAHRAAQGGGSGIDVAASVHGGVLLARRDPTGLTLEPASLPPGIAVSVLAAREPASTPELLARVRALSMRDSAAHARLMGRQGAASEQAAVAIRNGDAPAFLAALREQAAALSELGAAAGAPIVTPEVSELAEAAERSGCAALPAGAGGGDIVLWVAPDSGPCVPTHPRLDVLPLALGAAGLERLD